MAQDQAVIEALPETEAGVFGALFDVSREQGYERGYRRAIQDVLASLVTVTEAYLRARPGSSDDARRRLYAYVEFLEAHLESASRDTGFVNGGLGI